MSRRQGRSEQFRTVHKDGYVWFTDNKRRVLSSLLSDEGDARSSFIIGRVSCSEVFDGISVYSVPLMGVLVLPRDTLGRSAVDTTVEWFRGSLSRRIYGRYYISRCDARARCKCCLNIASGNWRWSRLCGSSRLYETLATIIQLTIIREKSVR